MKKINNNLKIGDKLYEGVIAIPAPMAGYTDFPFRTICEEFGAKLTFTEMVNANLLNRENDATINELLKCDDKEKTGTQIFGSNKNELLLGILKLEEIGFKKITRNWSLPF